jgi:simple sugar transport system permease protein
LGRLSPFGVVLAGILISGLLNGADALQRQVGIPASFANVIQAVVIFSLVLGSAASFVSIQKGSRKVPASSG